MPSEIEELIGKLREAEARRHAVSLQAIGTLEKNMIGSGPAMDGIPAEGGRPRGGRDDGPIGDVSNVDRVLNALDTKRFKPLDEIVGITGLDESQVRVALYSRSLQSRIEKTKVNKRTVFRIATATVRGKSQIRQRKGPSAAERVRSVLRQHPDGLRAAEIREFLPDISANTIGAALYNLKNKSKKAAYDESTQVYRLT